MTIESIKPASRPLGKRDAEAISRDLESLKRVAHASAYGAGKMIAAALGISASRFYDLTNVPEARTPFEQCYRWLVVAERENGPDGLRPLHVLASMLGYQLVPRADVRQMGAERRHSAARHVEDLRQAVERLRLLLEEPEAEAEAAYGGR